MTDQERRRLQDHGTKLMELKPSSIWAAAMADLERRKHNIKYGDFQFYAFHRDHVVSAESANDIIRAAIKDIEDAEAAAEDADAPVVAKGRKSGKANTRLIYSNVELLKAALR